MPQDPERGRGAARDGERHGDDVRRALTVASITALLAFGVLSGTALQLPWGRSADVAVGVLLALALVGLGSGVLAAARLVTAWLPARAGRSVVTTTAGVAVMLIAFAGHPPLLALALWAAWLLAFVVLALGVLAAWRFRGDEPGWRRVVRFAAPVAGAAAFIAAGVWWFGEGRTAAPPQLVGASAVPPIGVPAQVPDPGARGPALVASFTYGGAAPRWRSEYAVGVDVATTPVDLSDVLELGGVAAALRPTVLGHDLASVPRNGIVWHPAEGEGPFPLVLIAHGNANLFVPSELGYAWLGEHLAARGYVVASIDASAFNSLPLVGGLRGENHARALLMLAHLALWTELAERGHPVAATVDMDRVALVGHSRGGEAAAIAASLDRLGRLPENALTDLHERFGGPYGIRAVVAIAPSDGQYRVGDRGTELVGVDYLVLQGGHDADVSSFLGERQYERTHLTDGGFKAAVYLHHANHGQFNTRWGRRDLPPPLGTLLRTAVLLPGEDQRAAGAVAITAFLEASLRDRTDHLQLVRQPSLAPSWPDSTVVVTRFDDGAAVVLAAFDEDVDPTTATIPGGTIEADGLAVWREGDPGFRRTTPREANAVTLGWRPATDGSAPAYRVVLPEHGDGLEPATGVAGVRIDVARGTAAAGDVPAPRGPLDATIVVIDDLGRRASLPLSAGAGVPTDLPTTVSKFGLIESQRYAPDRYPVYATVELSLEHFVSEGEPPDPARLRELALVFDRTAEGIVIVRAIALVPAAGPVEGAAGVTEESSAPAH